MSGYEFDKYVNNVLSKQPEYEWIKDVSSKARKQSIMNAETAYKKFFNGQSKYPRFKKKNNQDTKIYLPKNNLGDFTIERHRIKVPTLGFIRLKEKGYIPVNSLVSSGTISIKANRFYISISVEEAQNKSNVELNENGIGVDLGIKEFAVVSNGKVYNNINKSSHARKLKKKLRREQRRLSRKYESKKHRKAGENPVTKNINKNVLRVQKIYVKLTNIRHDYVKKTVNELVKTKPAYITIENLNIKGLMKNKHLSRAIGEQNFYMFTLWLKNKCKQYGIELRQVDRFYPSSKKCNKCGNIKKDLKLSDREYNCEACDYKVDRDLGASINLAETKEYKVLI
jgi:putative transposase